MRNQEYYINWIERYIDGDLHVDDVIWVEQQLAEHELWRDVYEGMLVAQANNYDLDSSLSKLEKQLSEPKKSSGTIIPMAYRKWIISAAAIGGFLLLSYAAIQFINHNNSTVHHASTDVDPLIRHVEDEIQIIPPRRQVEPKVQVFSAEKIEKIASETMPIIEESAGITLDAELSEELNDRYNSRSAYAEQINEDLASRIQIVDSITKQVIDDYPKYLARYGYRVITDANLLNTERGASVPELPESHYRSEE